MRAPANRRYARARAGITLFEAVAAVTIVGVTSISALAAIGAEFRTAERAKRALEAEALATSRVSALDLLTDQELQSLPDSVASGVFPEPLNGYTWTTTSGSVSEQPGVYAVHISIGWTGGAYDVRTYVYRRPPIVSGNR
jgi:type II secretory pathway pseudopilin PulG